MSNISIKKQISIRRPVENDLSEIEDIAADYENNPLPTKFVTAAVVEKGDDVIAFATLRADLEAILYISASERDKVESLKLLIEQARKDAKSYGYEHIYVFADNPKFASVLSKHFGFKLIKSIPLILDL